MKIGFLTLISKLARCVVAGDWLVALHGLDIIIERLRGMKWRWDFTEVALEKKRQMLINYTEDISPIKNLASRNDKEVDVPTNKWQRLIRVQQACQVRYAVIRDISPG